MTNHKALLAGAVFASCLGFAAPSYAAVYVNIGPPEPRAEHFEPRSGYVVIPGVWVWRNGKHQWVGGHYVAAKKGYHYQADRWVKHDNDKWTMQRGSWQRDSDHDGVPDRADAHPNDPRRN